MNAIDFKWMIGRTIGQVTVTEPDYWRFKFTNGGIISTECPWRLLERNCIAVSNDDHKQQFGLPEPIDAEKLVSQLLSSLTVVEVEIRKGTADLLISFTQKKQLQIIPFSTGYESWQVQDPFGNNIIAQGGGQLCVFAP